MPTRDETAICFRCGQEWPRHPSLEVTCPACKASPGVRCKRPSGHSGRLIALHVEREQQAMDEGFLQRCPAADKPNPEPKLEPKKILKRERYAATPSALPLWEDMNT